MDRLNLSKILGAMFIFLVTTVCSTVTGFNKSQSTEIAANIFETMTAEVTPTSSPTITPSKTTTSSPTIAPTVAPTFTSTSIPPFNWALVISDSFDSNENDWPMGTETNDYVENNWLLFRGKYRWEAQAIQDVHWYVYPEIKSLGDFYLSTELRKISGPVDCSYGVAFRVRDDNNFYVFVISDTQYFSIFRKLRGSWDALVDWRYSDVIQPGNTNRLTVVAQGAHFLFLINNQQVTEVDDNKIEKGRNGLTMMLYSPGDQAVFEFDNFEVREP